MRPLKIRIKYIPTNNLLQTKYTISTVLYVSPPDTLLDRYRNLALYTQRDAW